MTKEFISDRFKELQSKIAVEIEAIDGNVSFHSDSWIREEGGGGITKTATQGNVLEKGGIAFSAVYGPVSEVMKRQLNLNGEEFYATGVSIVLHPINPFVPIIHMNVRYFELNDGTYWFGGGIDLTPHYIDDEMASKFHRRLHDICEKYDPDFYNRFKQQADDYFFLPHRNETRGIGGIFYDHLDNSNSISKDKLFEFCFELGENFPAIYAEQIQHGIQKEYAQNNLRWRNHRRGRYVEFNLVNDRGTKFGLFSGGRTESILMSLPPFAEWTYCHEIKPDSLEYLTQKKLKKAIDWLGKDQL